VSQQIVVEMISTTIRCVVKTIAGQGFWAGMLLWVGLELHHFVVST
jgi:hypothetical protein